MNQSMKTIRTDPTTPYPRRSYVRNSNIAYKLAQAQLRKEQSMQMLAMERFCREYSPNLPDEDVAKMIYERKQFFPEYDPKEPEVWDFRPHGMSYALISMCIKDDPNQSYAALANRLAQAKSMSYTGAAYMVATLRNKHRLSYYDAYYRLHPWAPGTPIILEPDLDD